MTLACPECGRPAPRDAVPGKAYACPGCRNPVLAADRPVPVVAPPAAPPPAPPPPGAAPPFPWKLALLAFVVLGAAYVGVYALLTAEAHRERDALTRLHGDAIETYEAPRFEVSPEDPAAYRAYLVERDRWTDRQRYEAHGQRIALMLSGMLFAFLAQTAVTTWLAVKTRQGSARGGARPRARAG